MRGQRGCYGSKPERPSTLGERIRAVRMSWGWTQKQLGEAVSSNPKTVWHWEKGRQAPSEAALGALALVFGLPKDALLTGKGFLLPGPPRDMAGMLVGDSYASDMVVLPKTREGWVVVIDKDTGRHVEKVWTGVLSDIRAAREEGRPIWVVFGPAPTSQSPNTLGASSAREGTPGNNPLNT